jgi:hypothetical protein
VLLEGNDDYRLTELEDREVYDAIENLYVGTQFDVAEDDVA